ncbi:MAG: DUF4397 domain-containing protein, partial [Chloroflexota bacterium]
IGEVTLEADDWYTISIIGEARRGRSLSILEEDYSEISFGETRITIFNAIPDGQTLSFFANDTRLVAGLAYPGVQGDNDGAVTVDIVAREYALLLNETDNDQRIIFNTTATLGNNRHYFVAAIGYDIRASSLFTTTNLTEFSTSGGVETESIQIDIGDGDARLRVGNFATDSPNFDLYLNGEPTDLADIDYGRNGRLTEWIVVPAGVYEIGLPGTGEAPDAGPIPNFNAIVVADTWNTLAIVGRAEDDSLISRQIVEDYSPIPRGESRLTFFHAIPDGPDFEVLINDQPFVNPLTYPGRLPSDENGAATIDVAEDSYDIEMVESGNIGNSFYELPEVPLRAGNHYFIAMVDDAGDVDLFIQPVTQEDVVQQFVGE